MKRRITSKSAPKKKAAPKTKAKSKRYREIHCKTAKEFNKAAQELIDGKLKGKVCVVLD
jgi:hypothetical protein